MYAQPVFASSQNTIQKSFAWTISVRIDCRSSGWTHPEFPVSSLNRTLRAGPVRIGRIVSVNQSKLRQLTLLHSNQVDFNNVSATTNWD